jgi:hypothetical protein
MIGWRDRMLASGRCPDCGAEATFGVRCDRCAEVNRAAARKRYKRQLGHGPTHYRARTCSACKAKGHDRRVCGRVREAR